MKPGKWILSFMALFTAVTPYLADWNETHIYNPVWTGHAKFHNAQTMLFGTFLGLIALSVLWLRKNISEKERLNETVVLVSLYWLSQLPAILFPGTAFEDKEFQTLPTIAGIKMNQVILSMVFILPLIMLGYFLERRRISKVENRTKSSA